MSVSPGVRLAGLAALLVTLLLVAAAPASARSFVLRASGNPTGPGEVLAIGDFKPPANPTVRRAVRVFGDPTSRRGAGEACSIRWARFGLRIKFANFGGSIACGPRGLAQKAIITGDRRWRTAEAFTSATASPACGGSTRMRSAPRAASGSWRASCPSAGPSRTRCSGRA